MTGTGTEARLHWDVDTDRWAAYVSVKHPGEDGFNHGAQAFHNSVPLNRLNLALGDNQIKVANPDGRTVLEGTTMVTYESGYAIYTLTVHKEQQVAVPGNFRIEMMPVYGLSLTWDRDPVTNGNSISNNWTLIEVKNPGQEEFRDAPIGGVLFGISLQDSGALRSWIHYGENFVRIRIATGNVSIIGGVVTRHTPSDWGYVVLFRDANGNISIKN